MKHQALLGTGGRNMQAHPFGQEAAPSPPVRARLVRARADVENRNLAVRCTRELYRLVKDAGPWHFLALAVEAGDQGGLPVHEALLDLLAALKAERRSWADESALAADRLGDKRQQLEEVVDECLAHAAEAHAPSAAPVFGFGGGPTAQAMRASLHEAAAREANRLARAVDAWRNDPERDLRHLRGVGIDHLLRAKAPLAA
ncbi:hypothetical protein [Ramlibacter sp.]|uniref:hypothetical protein n=1 Tax=Ramlibacter sp. TaxID=1917967 RepID=UPI0026022925|nr:hypothetical protein [Ramlibacter sp.]MDB5957520.1 hypothetical protein [Ramlibacter sp.]